jgi:hypothetical protein
VTHALSAAQPTAQTGRIHPCLRRTLRTRTIIFYRRGLPLLSGSGMRYTPFRNESARIEPLGQESCQRAYRCATRFGGSPKKPPAFMWRSRHGCPFLNKGATIPWHDSCHGPSLRAIVSYFWLISYKRPVFLPQELKKQPGESFGTSWHKIGTQGQVPAIAHRPLAYGSSL